MNRHSVCIKDRYALAVANGLSVFRRTLVTLLAVIFSASAAAHDPHQVIEDVEVGMLPSGDTAIFLINDHYRLQVSNDGVVFRHLALGLDGWGPLTDIALAPDLPASGLLVLATLGNGVYVSDDSGRSWRNCPDGPQSVSAVAVASTDSGHVILAAAADGGLARSLDRGATWRPSLPSDVMVTALHTHGSAVLFAGDRAGGVHRSSDLGETWQRLGGIADAGDITSFALSSDGARLLVGTNAGGIFSTLLDPVQFEASSTGLVEMSVQSIAVAPHDPKLVVATTWREGAHVSVDGGASWTLAAQGLFSNEQADTPAYFSPHYREVRFIDAGEERGTAFLAGYNGLFRSSDPANGWAPVQTFHDSRVFSVRAGLGAGGQETVLYSTYFTGIFVGDGSGRDWHQARVEAPIPKLRASEIIFAPPRDGVVDMFGILDGGDDLLRSRDGGASWQATPLAPHWFTELKVKVIKKLYWLGVPASWTVDTLSREERLAAWPRAVALSPNFDTDNSVYVVTRHRGLYQSRDAGETVEHVDADLSEFWELASAAGPDGEVDLFTSAREHGVFASDDGGRTWTAQNEGLEFLADWQLLRETGFGESEFRRSEFYSLRLATSPAYARDATVFVGGGAGLYKSTNRGAHWSRMAAVGLGKTPFLLTFSLSPRFEFDQTLFASVKGRGLFRSRDGGATFAPVAPDIIGLGQDVFHVAFAGGYPDLPTLYVASLEEVWQSNDDAQSWHIVERPGRLP